MLRMVMMSENTWSPDNYMRRLWLADGSLLMMFRIMNERIHRTYMRVLTLAVAIDDMIDRFHAMSSVGFGLGFIILRRHRYIGLSWQSSIILSTLAC